MKLFEKYRPATLREVLGQDKAVKQIEHCMGHGWGEQAFWISGASGTGKTTLAIADSEKHAVNWAYAQIEAGLATWDLFWLNAKKRGM